MNKIDTVVVETLEASPVRSETDSDVQRICLKLDAIEQKIDLRFDLLTAEIRNLANSIAANHAEVLRAIESLRNGDEVMVSPRKWTN
jgi:hypothetical protein